MKRHFAIYSSLALACAVAFLLNSGGCLATLRQPPPANALTAEPSPKESIVTDDDPNAEDQALKDAEAKALKDAEAKALKDAEAKAQEDAVSKIQKDVVTKAQEDSEEKAQTDVPKPEDDVVKPEPPRSQRALDKSF